jgi:hypothetical protein
MASLRLKRPEQRIADRDLATCHHLGVDPRLIWPNARPRAATMSRSRFAVTGRVSWLTSIRPPLTIIKPVRRTSWSYVSSTFRWARNNPLYVPSTVRARQGKATAID